MFHREINQKTNELMNRNKHTHDLKIEEQNYLRNMLK